MMRPSTDAAFDWAAFLGDGSANDPLQPLERVRDAMGNVIEAGQQCWLSCNNRPEFMATVVGLHMADTAGAWLIALRVKQRRTVQVYHGHAITLVQKGW